MGNPKAPDLWEQDAGAVVAAATGARMVWNDDGSADRQVDWRLFYADGRCGALEVTRSVDPQAMEQIAALTRRGFTLHIPGLRYGWHVHLRPGGSITALPARLPDILHRAESLELHEFGRGIANVDLRGRELWVQLEQLEQQLERLGCAWASTVEGFEPGQVALTPPGTGSWDAGVDGIPGWLEDFLPTRASDLAKLADSGADEAHLFVFADISTGLALLWALGPDQESLPARHIALPRPLTHVWLTTSAVRRRVVAQIPGPVWMQTGRRERLAET